MKRELHIHIGINPEMVVWGMIASLLAALPASVGSETVTLQTYYPSPYGMYTQMRTMGQTTLAESGGEVGIGLGAGVAPQDMLDVKGAMALGSYAGVVHSPPVPSGSLILNGQVGIGTTNPLVGQVGGDPGQYGLNIQGPNSDIYARSIHLNPTCSAMSTYDDSNYPSGVSPPGGFSPDPPSCPGGQYATWIPGVWFEGNSYQQRPAYDQTSWPYIYMSPDRSGAGWVFQDQSVATWYCCND